MRSAKVLAGACLLAAGLIGPLWAEGPSEQPRPVPLTRPEMKRVLEGLKQRSQRIPLPADAGAADQPAGTMNSYEAQLRTAYLPPSDSMAAYGFMRQPDPKMTLDYLFKTKMFWIVSRTNNCHYCLGHQEIKLSLAGMLEDQIAALDSDWSEFTPAEQAAFKFARKLTFDPQHLSDADIDALRPHFNDLQILEIIFSLAGNNAINRWKEGAGIPQEPTAAHFVARQTEPVPQDRPLPIESFLTPTADRFQQRPTQVASHEAAAGAEAAKTKTGAATTAAIENAQLARPKLGDWKRQLEGRDEAERQLELCRHRTPRLPLVDDADARQLLGDHWTSAEPVPQWMRLLANFPVHGVARVVSGLEADESGDLSPLVKAQVSWIVARQDRAWYATGEAMRRLKALGQTDEQIWALDGDWSGIPESSRAMFRVARNLAASPIVLTDADIQHALAAVGPRDVVQLIYYTTNRASFDRLTEAAGLQLEN